MCPLADLVGHRPQRQFTQRQKIPLAEEIRQRLIDFVLLVDLAETHPFAQVVGGHVHVEDLVSPIKDRVGAVSRTGWPVRRLTVSFSVSRCWMLIAVMTLMPAPSTSSTS